MPEKALVRADGTLIRIGNFADGVGVRDGLTLMDVERFEVDLRAGGYMAPIQVTEGVVAGKWRITKTLSDLSGAALDAYKTARVSEADRALARGLMLAFNALFFLVNDVRARHGQAARTLAQFKADVDGLTTIDETAFIAWLKDKL